MRDFRDAKTMAHALRDIAVAEGRYRNHPSSECRFRAMEDASVMAKLEHPVKIAPRSRQKGPTDPMEHGICRTGFAPRRRTDDAPTPKTLYCTFCGKMKASMTCARPTKTLKSSARWLSVL